MFIFLETKQIKEQSHLQAHAEDQILHPEPQDQTRRLDPGDRWSRPFGGWGPTFLFF